MKVTYAAALSVLTFGGVAAAQDAPATQAQAAGAAATAQSGAVQLEEVTVTGSRIKRTTDFNTPTPTTVIDSSTMESLGIVNVGQTLTVTPANVSTFTPANTGNSNFFSGSYIADLRGLNPFFGSRTLVLVNTRRVVQTNQGDSVDLNFIPQILVQRVDTVTGGASAAYGSGAIAGVVNVILDNKLEGGKITGDWYETSHSDAKDRHIGAAYGHGFFDNRIHFVVGGEYENQDALGCVDARSWCAANQGFYQGTTSPFGVTPLIEGTNLRANQVGVNGVFFTGSPTASSTLQATPSGTATEPFALGLQPYASVSRNVAPGGDGAPIYAGGNGTGVTSLMAPVNRGVITGTLTAAITDNINFSADANWGKVVTTDFNGGGIDYGDSITKDNAFIQGNSALVSAVGSGASLNKFWLDQVPDLSRVTTDVKRFSFGFDGKFGESSWTWDTYYEYGLTEREQLVQDSTHLYEEYMALDSVLVNGQPECRVTAAGGVGPAIGQSLASGDGFPLYGLAPASEWAALAQGCVPLNPFGNQPLSQDALGYAFGNLDERLRYEQTVAAADVSGNYFRGIGAGPFSAAAGVEWRQEVGHNDEAPCPAGTSGDVCHAKITDFLIQYGEPFGGAVTVDEAYLETNLPLAKNLPGAHLLEIDLAGRESRYDNKALYGIDVVNGVQPEFTHNLTTWKASAIYEPVDWLRFRGSQSRDARAGNFRELYYGQVISAGGLFGYCGSPGTFSDPCTYNLEGNVNIKPETSDTTTLGLILTPRELLPGFQFSADWFHIKINNAIEQASTQLVTAQCKAGVASACDQMVFQSAGVLADGRTACDGSAGAAAYQAGCYNVKQVTALSYNGAFYEVRGIDFSLNYLLDLGNAGSLSTRLLTTWNQEQKFASCSLGVQYGCLTYNILGQTGSGNSFLNDYTPEAKWRGSLMLTWAKGPLSITPSMNFVSHGTMDYLGVTPSQGALYTAALNNPNLLAPGIDLHPLSNNYVPSYFLFNLNGTYSFENVEALKGLQLFVQINNVFNKTPPFAGGGGAFGPSNSYGGTNPIFFDTLGLAWRAGFRLSF